MELLPLTRTAPGPRPAEAADAAGSGSGRRHCAPLSPRLGRTTAPDAMTRISEAAARAAVEAFYGG